MKVGIAGAGTMGSGIAQIFARKGNEVVITDIKEEFLDKSKKLVSIFNDSLIEENLMTKEEAENIVNNISYSTDKNTLKGADLVIEAIVEKLDVKQSFWSEVESIVSEDTILATNTSGLSITKIGEKLNNKERFIGMHFWNPPHIIPLVELTRGDFTSDETVEKMLEIVKDIDKEPVVVQKDVAGFIGNRLQFAVFREALHILEEGIASAEDIDKAMKFGPGFRYPIIGSLETADLGGLDTFYYIASYLFDDLSDVKEPQEILKKFMEKGELGVKTEKGFYDYSDGKDEEAIKHRDKMFFKMLKHIHNS